MAPKKSLTGPSTLTTEENASVLVCSGTTIVPVLKCLVTVCVLVSTDAWEDIRRSGTTSGIGSESEFGYKMGNHSGIICGFMIQV